MLRGPPSGGKFDHAGHESGKGGECGWLAFRLVCGVCCGPKIVAAGSNCVAGVDGNEAAVYFVSSAQEELSYTYLESGWLERTEEASPRLEPKAMESMLISSVSVNHSHGW